MAQKEGTAAGDSSGAKGVPAGGVVVAVREKKGPLRAAIPTMPFPLAVICLFLNTFIPGLGTFISAFTVLCGARSELTAERGVCCVFWLNVAAALIQAATAVIMFLTATEIRASLKTSERVRGVLGGAQGATFSQPLPDKTADTVSLLTEYAEKGHTGLRHWSQTNDGNDVSQLVS